MGLFGIESIKSSFLLGPDLLEGGEGDDEGVEAVEGGLHVDADAQRPHPQQHLEDEQTQEDELGSV